MFIVIVGSGEIGSSLAQRLVAAGHEIGVIESDQGRCTALEDELGHLAVLGDGTEAASLARAGVGRADILIATTSRDEDNLVACQLARYRFQVPRTIAVVSTPEHARLFPLLGVEAAVDVTDLAVSHIQERISVDGMVHLIPMPGDQGRTLVMIRIPQESRLAGRPIKDIALPDDALISMVISRGGTASVPDENTLVQAEDEILAVTNTQRKEELRELFTEQFRESG